MKKILLLMAVFALFAAAAHARIITYTWHQTSASYPGFDVTASYSIVQNVPPHDADSKYPPFDFGGLVDFYIQGGSYPAITLAGLIPSCEGPGLCVVKMPPGCQDPDCHIEYHDPGSPEWQLDWWSGDIGFFYLVAREVPPPVWHIEWDYWASTTRIDVNDDYADALCFDWEACTSYGYWVADYAPEPATLLSFGGGLALVQLSLAARRKRKA